MNFKFKRLYHRVFSIFLVIVLSVLSVPISAVAKGGNEESLNISTSAPISDSTIATDLSQEVIWPVVSDEEAMRREQLIQNGYSPDDYSVSEYKQMVAKGELQPLAVYPAVLADGVYAIKNIGNSSGSTGFYLDTALAHWLPGYNMQQYKFTNGGSPLDNFSTSALFKITRKASSGSYVIRIMRNNVLSFGIRLNPGGSNEILTKKIPLDDSEVELSDTYTITTSGSGYKICKYGTTNLIATKDTTASGAAGAPDSYLYASSAIGDHTRWTFSAYTGPERNEMTMLGSGSLEVAKTSTLDPVFYSTRPGYNVVSLNMSQVPTSYYHLSGPSDYGIYSLTPHQGTTWNVGIYLKNGSSSTASSILIKTETWNIALPIDEGIYFFKNKEVGKYIQIDDNDEPNYSTNGSHMELFGFDGGDYQKWQLDHISDGYYKILSVKSEMALCVPSGSINEDEVALVQESYSNLSRMKWKITKSSSGAYILRPKSGDSYDTDWCMCAGDQFLGITDGLNVEQKAYVNNSNYKDEWELFKIEYDSLVPGEGQQKSNWCWVTSARMFSKHLYPSITYTQSNAVTYVKGSDVNESGNRAEAQQAINYYISNISGASIDTVIKEHVIYSEENLVRFLDNGYVIYIARGWYEDTNDPTTREGGHATLIYGYTTVDSEIWFLVRDPWPINKGKSYIISYDKLCNGANCKPGEESDTGVWSASIVVNTSYANETIPYYFDK